MSELEEFIRLNDIKEEELLAALHLDIREVLLKIVCEKLKKEPSFFSWAKKVFFATDNLKATRIVVEKACKCQLSEDDILWMQICIKAFFSKSGTRRQIPMEEKKRLLEIQGNRCAICGCEITIQNMHVDHIIPWDYVGDQLNDNYQGLCENCNLSKSNHVAKTVTNLILHRR